MDIEIIDQVASTREFIIAKFNARWPDLSEYPHRIFPSPSYKEVRAVDPELFKSIMNRFGGYRAFLRYLKRPMPITSDQERAFINLSSKASLEYNINRWSSLEESVWAILEFLDLNEGFIHNCPFPSPKGSYYQLDFFNPWIRARIEVNGVFHQALPQQKEQDELKDRYLARFGIRTLHIVGKDIEDPELVRIISRFINSCQNRYLEEGSE